MTRRIFIAIDLPAPVVSDISYLQSRLDELLLPLNLERLEKLHLTLNFLGRIDPDQLHQVRSIAGSVSNSFAPFTVSLPFLETLYHRHESSLVYLRATSPDLLDLQKSLSHKLNFIQLTQPRRFLPHVTIAKLKKSDPQTTKRVLGQINDLEYSPLSPFEVDHLTLYESLLSRSGSTYQRISTFVLKSEGI